MGDRATFDLRDGCLGSPKKLLQPPSPQDRVLMLNVGGMHFSAAKDTLFKHDSYFSRLYFNQLSDAPLKDPTGRWFIDRDGTHFRYILNYLRDGSIPVLDPAVSSELAREATFYGLTSLVEAIDRDDTTLGMFKDITGDALRAEHDAWVRRKNLEDRAVLGQSFACCVDLLFSGIRAHVLKGFNRGSLALLTSDKLPPEMSFARRGKVVALVPPENEERELPLMYHDWAGSHRKMDFIAIQQRVWDKMLESAVVSPHLQLIWDDKKRDITVEQLRREFASRKLKSSIEKEVWLNLTTPVYSGGADEGPSIVCPVKADYCSGWFLKWEL